MTKTIWVNEWIWFLSQWLILAQFKKFYVFQFTRWLLRKLKLLFIITNVFGSISLFRKKTLKCNVINFRLRLIFILLLINMSTFLFECILRKRVKFIECLSSSLVFSRLILFRRVKINHASGKFRSSYETGLVGRETWVFQHTFELQLIVLQTWLLKAIWLWVIHHRLVIFNFTEMVLEMLWELLSEKF